MEESVDYGRATRICRAARGVSQSSLASSAGLDPSFLSLIEAGKRQPSTKTVHALAEALRVPAPLFVLLASPAESVKQGHAEDVHALSHALLRLLTSEDPETEDACP